MAEIVKVQIRPADSSSGSVPVLLQDMRTEETTVLAGHDQGVRLGAGELLQVANKRWEHVGRNGDSPPPGVALGSLEEQLACLPTLRSFLPSQPALMGAVLPGYLLGRPGRGAGGYPRPENADGGAPRAPPLRLPIRRQPLLAKLPPRTVRPRSFTTTRLWL